MVIFDGGLPVLNPKPQVLTSGATVISNEPLVLSAICSARLNTALNISLVSTFSPRLTREIIDLSLNMDKALSTLSSSARMSLLREESF